MKNGEKSMKKRPKTAVLGGFEVTSRSDAACQGSALVAIARPEAADVLVHAVARLVAQVVATGDGTPGGHAHQAQGIPGTQSTYQERRRVEL